MPDIYPLQVEINEDNLVKIIKTFKTAYKEISDEILTATDFGVANRKAILKQIEKVLTDLGADVSDIVTDEMRTYYEDGANDAIKQLNNVNAPLQVEKGFNQIHKEAIYALVDETNTAFGDSITGVYRSAQRLLGREVREQLTQKIATGLLKGAALDEAKKSIKGILADEGLSALTDKRGREWSLDRYAEMLFRTKAVEARNRGLVNRMVENGYDLVQCSAHFGSCPLCEPWQGKILSITGETKGYETVRQAEEAGLFHPNCRHAINTLVPSLARLTRAYDPTTKTLSKPGASIRTPIENRTKERLLDPAKKYHATFENKIENIAKSGDWTYSVAKVKKLERSVDKIMYDYDGSITDLKDALRSAIFISDPNNKAELAAIEKAVKDEFGNIYRIKNELDNPTGYKKMMINVQTKPGVIAEVQITTPEMWEAKHELGGDALYNKVRSGLDKTGEFEKKMNDLYKAANAKTKARLS